METSSVDNELLVLLSKNLFLSGKKMDNPLSTDVGL